MNVLASLLVLVAFGVAAALAIPATRRTGLGIWHPVIAWLVLDAVFFGVGSIRLAIDDRVGPALYVAGCTLALAVGVAVSERLASRRATVGSGAAPDPSPETSRRAGDADHGRGGPRSPSASRRWAWPWCCRPSCAWACRPLPMTSPVPGAS